jgi:hypothetical protein
VNDPHDDGSTPQTERRQRQDLRNIFDGVQVLVAPFCQPGNAMEYWAYHAVREAYPDLDEQGLQIVVGAALRVCRSAGTAK